MIVLEKKRLTIIIVLILILAAAALIYFGLGNKLPFGGKEDSTSGDANGGDDTSQEQSIVSKLSDALKVGTAMKCTWSEGDTSTIFYIKGGKLRGSAGTDNGEMEYILRDNCYYYWSTNEEQGYKMYWDPTDADALNWEESMQAAKEMYNCKSATISDSMFNPPSGINFVDISQWGQYGQ